MSEDTPPAAQPVAKPVTVQLAEPIQREGGNVPALTLRKPKAGELRGLSISNLVNSDVGAILTLLPRICEPHITDTEAAGLSTEDFAEVAGTVVGFFMSAAQKAMIERMAGVPSTI